MTQYIVRVTAEYTVIIPDEVCDNIRRYAEEWGDNGVRSDATNEEIAIHLAVREGQDEIMIDEDRAQVIIHGSLVEVKIVDAG